MARCPHYAPCWTLPKIGQQAFYRGNDLYDWEDVGFVWDVAEEDGHNYFPFDTTLSGNNNGGHSYGTDLTPTEKDALIEYLKTQ